MTSASNSFHKAPLMEPPGSSNSPDFTRSTKRPKLESSSVDPNMAQSAPATNQFASTQPMDAPPSAPVLAKAPVKQEVESTPSQADKGNEDSSLLNSFTVEQLTTHLESLNRSAELPPAKLKQKCMEVLKGLQAHQHGWVFNTPVDPVELGLPDYFEIIKKPMHLRTVQK